jgi:hypothetical protein
MICGGGGGSLFGEKLYTINKNTEVASEVEKTKHVFTASKCNNGLNHKIKIINKFFVTADNENLQSMSNLENASYYSPRIICYSSGYLNI